MSSTATATSDFPDSNPASGKPVVLESLDDWLEKNPEPEAPLTPQKKAKKALEPRAIIPLTLDPDDKTNWIGKLYG